MASPTLWFSTVTGTTGYTDSGGGTSYFAYMLRLAANVDATISQSSAACIAGPVGATGILENQNSTNLVWVSEQLAGANWTTGPWTFNVWAQASTAGTNAGLQVRIQQLSSNSTFIQNFTNNEFGTATKSTAFTANNWTTGGTTGVTVVTSGQRLGALIAINDSTGVSMVAGGVIRVTFGLNSTGASGDSWLTSPVSLSTFAPASTGTIFPFANSLALVGFGVSGIEGPDYRFPGITPDPTWLRDG